MYRIDLKLDGTTYPIPVLPETLSVKCAGNSQTAMVLGLGEINRLRGQALTEVAWESFFPADLSLPCISATRAYEPSEYARRISAFLGKKKAGRLYIEGDGIDLSLPVSVDSFSYEERGGQEGDLYYTIRLREWKDYSPISVSVGRGDQPTGRASQQDREGTPGKTGPHTVVAGDCLWMIAQTYYGDGSRYPEIYAANKAQIDAGNRGTGNPKYTIYPGQVFTIP